MNNYFKLKNWEQDNDKTEIRNGENQRMEIVQNKDVMCFTSVDMYLHDLLIL